MEIKKIFVAGAGLMGSGISQVCAQSGMTVVLYDISQEALEKGLKNITWSVSKLVEKGKLTEQEGREFVDQLLNKSEEAREELQAQIEAKVKAVLEKMDLKKEVFKES